MEDTSQQFICTCQKFCHAPPEGKKVSRSTWYGHKAQRELEMGLTPAELDSVQRPTRKRRRKEDSGGSRSQNNPPDIPLPDLADPLHPDPFLPSNPTPRDDLTPELMPDMIHAEGADQPEEHDPDLDSADEEDLFNLDGSEDMPDPPVTPPQPRAQLEDLAIMQDFLEYIKNYDFEHEKLQWGEDDFENFFNPPKDWGSEHWDFDDPQLRLSLRTYMALTSHSSEAAYEEVRRAIKSCYPDSTMLSFDQVRRRLKWISGINPLYFDMCPANCVGFTGPWSTKEHCPVCGEARYKDDSASVPKRQFVTLPIGPQLQAFWRHPKSAANMRDRLRRTARLLAQSDSGGITDYFDLCCGAEYLAHVRSGAISDEDMVLVFSMDGAQIYQDKKSDCWFGIMELFDLAPELRHDVVNVAPVFLVGGPDPPKHLVSFLCPIFAHLAACQRHGIKVWDASRPNLTSAVSKKPWFAHGTADTVGITELLQWVGHHGRNGCRLMCPMEGRHKPRVPCYYPAMFKPNDGSLPAGSDHPTIDPNSISTTSPEKYRENVNYVLASRTQTDYKRRRKLTGIKGPSILSALPYAFAVPGCCPGDTMHLFSLNIPQLIISLWRGDIDHASRDPPSAWDFAVLRDKNVWEAHGAAVAAASRYIPVCIESRVPRNPAEKISSGFKAVEYLIYFYGLCPALLYGILPPPFYLSFCKLVYATRIALRHHVSHTELEEAHNAFLSFVVEFELLYYEQKLDRLHFVRPCIHALTHIVPEILRVGSLTELSQWTMERTIGNVVEELRLHSNPYANLTQRLIDRARTNALRAMAPELFEDDDEDDIPSNGVDIGDNYVLLGPRELHTIRDEVLTALQRFTSTLNWRIRGIESGIQVDRFSRLRLPNGMKARTTWQEKKRPDEQVRPARNVRIHLREIQKDGVKHIAEVLYFFMLEKSEKERYTLAAVQLYSIPDPDLLTASYNILSVHKKLGDEGIQIIDAKWISHVVAMIPFQPGRRTDEFFLLEKISLGNEPLDETENDL